MNISKEFFFKAKDKFLSFFTHHPWLKIISLILAIVIWFYIRYDISRFSW